MSLIVFALWKMDFESSIVKLQKQSKFQKIFLERIRGVRKGVFICLRLTSNLTERFLTFSDLNCQERCTESYKTFKVSIPLESKKI